MFDLGNMSSFLEGKKVALPLGVLIVATWLLIWGVRINDASIAHANDISALQSAQISYAKDMTKLQNHMTILRAQNKAIAHSVKAVILDDDDADDK